MSSSTGNNPRVAQNGFVPLRNGHHVINNDLRRGRMDMHSRNGNGLETTGSIDSWKTGGGNGDSGYTNRTTTTLPMNRNSINSSTVSADFQNIPSLNNESGNLGHNNSRIEHNTSSCSPYVMPMPPGTHSQIGDVINSHHVLSLANRNNICR